jgi:hypothetical protein
LSFHCNTYTQSFKENKVSMERIELHTCTHQMENLIIIPCYKTSKLQIFTHTKTYLATKPSNHKMSPNWTLLNSKLQSFTSNNNPHKNEFLKISLILKTSKSENSITVDTTTHTKFRRPAIWMQKCISRLVELFFEISMLLIACRLMCCYINY